MLTTDINRCTDAVPFTIVGSLVCFSLLAWLLMIWTIKGPKRRRLFAKFGLCWAQALVALLCCAVPCWFRVHSTLQLKSKSLKCAKHRGAHMSVFSHYKPTFRNHFHFRMRHIASILFNPLCSTRHSSPAVDRCTATTLEWRWTSGSRRRLVLLLVAWHLFLVASCS